VGPAGRRYRSIAAWMALQQHTATARHAAANVVIQFAVDVNLTS